MTATPPLWKENKYDQSYHVIRRIRRSVITRCRALFAHHKYQTLYTLSQHLPSPQQYCSRLHRPALHMDADAVPTFSRSNVMSDSPNAVVTVAHDGDGAGGVVVVVIIILTVVCVGGRQQKKYDDGARSWRRVRRTTTCVISRRCQSAVFRCPCSGGFRAWRRTNRYGTAKRVVAAFATAEICIYAMSSTPPSTYVLLIYILIHYRVEIVVKFVVCRHWQSIVLELSRCYLWPDFNTLKKQK